MGNLFRKLVAYLITFPLFLLLLGFVVLNRHGVSLYLNPLEFGIIPAEVFLPLSVIILLSISIGALIGALIVRISMRARIKALKAQLKTAQSVPPQPLSLPPSL